MKSPLQRNWFVLLFAVLGPLTGHGAVTHDLDNLLTFLSTNAIVDHFVVGEKTPVHQVALTKYADRHFILTAFPYSGSDTIDVYCFIKHGVFWRIQLTYFALEPSNRQLRAAERDNRIDVLDADKILFSFTPGREFESVRPEDMQIATDLISQLVPTNQKPHLVLNEVSLPGAMYDSGYKVFASRLRRSSILGTKPPAVAAAVDDFLVRNEPSRTYTPVTAQSSDVAWVSGDALQLQYRVRHFTVSVAGTDADKKWAIIYVGDFEGAKASGALYLLRNTGSGWALDCELGARWAF